MRLPWMPLLLASALVVAPACASTGAAPADPPARPNVVLVCVDDLRPLLGCYGSGAVVSPNIDRLAAEGRAFTRHYVQVAICGPSRCSLLTGRRTYSWDCWGALRKREDEPAYPTSFAHLFRRNGYRTVCIGKVSHLPGGVMDKEQKVHQVPFSWDVARAPVGPWRTPWRAFFSYDKGRAYNKVIRMEKDAPSLPYECANVPDTGYADGLNAEEGVRQLRDLKSRGRPFLLAVGFYKPHLPFNAPKRYWDLYDRAKLPAPPHPSPPAGVDSKISLHTSYELTTHYKWPSGAGTINDAEARLLRHAYFACVSYVDAQIGKVLDEVKRLGLEKTTVVALWSDHGWHLGDHGIFGKHTNHEIAVRSPLIIKAPWMPAPGARAGGLAESVDLYPTLAELCGLKAPAGLDGTSLVPLLRDPEADGKAFAFSFIGRNKLMGRTVRTGRYRFVIWQDAGGKAVQTELYDHAGDPHEAVNIASRPEYAPLVERLARQAAMYRWQTRHVASEPSR
jgi:arylsulfatase A-like enzyme